LQTLTSLTLFGIPSNVLGHCNFFASEANLPPEIIYKTPHMSNVKIMKAVSFDSWYKDWFDSHYYHSLYQNRNDSEAEYFITNLVKLLRPATDSRMLDLACGKGRHSKLLASKGYLVNGVDLSTESIKAARRHRTPFLDFHEHDMRVPFRLNHFDYVFNFFTSFGYFREEAENNMVVKAISDSLKPKGMMMIDFLNVSYAEERQNFHEIKELDGITYSISKWHDQKRFYKRIVINHDRLKERDEFVETVAKYKLENFNRFFTSNKLRLKYVFGDYGLGSYNEKQSPRLIMLAEKL
jgi:SAM-dependent methyltransferase